MTAAEGLGFEIIADEEVDLIGNRLARLGIPDGLTLAEARQRLVTARPAVTADLNHYYRPEAEPECSSQPCLARLLIGWPTTSSAISSAAPRIGLVDTGINLTHEALVNQNIDFTDLSGKARAPSSKVHGTAVAALLVGARDSRSPGLLPDAELVAVDAFHRSGRDDRTDVFDLVRAMNIVASKDVDVINLSLTGPDNAVLERAVAAIAEKDIMIVAAAGNKGPNADPLYPAAYPNVTVATAVDRRHRVYRRAGRGEHVDFAAPGVNVWAAASIRGARLKTGTSFAAPFVTAAIGYMRARSPEMTRAQVKNALAAAVEDLGEPGRDPIFGWGLLRMDRLELAADALSLPKPSLAAEPGEPN
ncbi:S8 family serine peptidase [Allomesorhizobium camelthorni]|uniref:S8 family serine peptidase n=1 Tax=Allomesorhizobium camelthorni TaxID=475069 RepID=A0A6G4WLM7_9HYPH|nr:S8 family serine peptidase [Mesorhizobium camelthorni]NGO55722.1 S8 family serine peptidase [Mesorhizobium camelthorni]